MEVVWVARLEEEIGVWASKTSHYHEAAKKLAERLLRGNELDWFLDCW